MFIIFFEYVVAKNFVIEVFIFFFEFSIIIILTLSNICDKQMSIQKI